MRRVEPLVSEDVEELKVGIAGDCQATRFGGGIAMPVSSKSDLGTGVIAIS